MLRHLARADAKGVDLGAQGLDEAVTVMANVALVEGTQEQPWRYGDSVRVVMTPYDSARARELFVAGGGWSVLRLSQRPPQGLAVKLYHPDTRIELRVPYFPITAPDILIPRPR